jgi:chaperone modulatory protein CbpM
MTERETLRGTVLDETLTLTLREVCEVCRVEEVRVVEMVTEGIAEPLDAEAGSWTFSGVAVTRIRTAHRLQQDLHVNLAGAALALDLLEEIERLR